MKIRTFTILILTLAVISGVSCVSAPHVKSPDGVDRLNAEYRLMKNKLNLVMRENEVVKGENQLYRSEIKELKEKNTAMKTELDSLNQKYEQDMAALNEKLETLQSQYTGLEEESALKIKDLTDAKLKAEDILDKETQRFNQTLKDQQETFANEKSAMESQFAEKKLEYEGKLNSLTKELSEKDALLESMKADLAESKVQNETLNNRLASQQETVDALQKKVEDLLATIKNMNPSLRPPK